MQARDTKAYDVAVVGGGAAGVAAAIAAARLGARTLLLEHMGFLGGAATARNVLTYCGLFTLGDTPKQAVRGVAEDVLDGLRRLNAVTSPMRHRGVFVVFDPEAVKLTLDLLCAEADVDVFLHSFVSEAEREGDKINSIIFDDHGGRHRIRAEAWVDASGDCDLATFAGASVRYGNYGQVNLGTLGTRYGGIPADVEIDPDRFNRAVDKARASGRPLTKRCEPVRAPARLG
jgi:flavin-dependent dehydrogenase